MRHDEGDFLAVLILFPFWGPVAVVCFTAALDAWRSEERR